MRKKELIQLYTILSKSKYSNCIYNNLFDGNLNYDEAYLILKYIDIPKEYIKDFNSCVKENDDNLNIHFAYIDEEYYKEIERRIITSKDSNEIDEFKHELTFKDQAMKIRNKIFEALQISNINEITRKLIIENIYNKFKSHTYKGNDWYLKVYDETEIAQLYLDSIESENEEDYLNMEFHFKYQDKYYIMFLRNKKYERRKVKWKKRKRHLK